jgi:hypothetical protein
LKPRIVRFEVRPATYALLRQTQQALAEADGKILDDDALVAAVCTATLARLGSDSAAEDSGNARFQILTVICDACKQGFQEGAGVRVPIDAADRECAECDAQRIGSDTAPLPRATQDVTPAKRRAVRRRDGGKCCVPGCRASRFLAIHHIVAQADGGLHELENLTLLCDGHHRALHDGKLTITGKAPNLVVQFVRPDDDAHVGIGRSGHDEVADMDDDACGGHGGRSVRSEAAGDDDAHVGTSRPGDAPSRFERVKMMTEAKQALVQLKIPKHLARDAVAAAMERLGANATVGTLCYEALRSPPK